MYCNIYAMVCGICFLAAVNVILLLMTDSQIALVYQTVGKRMQEIRAQKRITQAAIAAEAGLTRQSVANIEHGRQRFMFHTLLSIAHTLGIPPSELLPKHDDGVEAIVKRDALENLGPAA